MAENRTAPPIPNSQKAWTPDGWKGFPTSQQPEYADGPAVESIQKALRHLPPLVHPGETAKLQTLIGDAARGERFLIQAGDCAETFADSHPESIEQNLSLIFEVASVVEQLTGLPAVRIGRIAGQYAKPRTHPWEEKDDRTLPVYRGDMVNGAAFESDARKPDPARMLQAYRHSAATLNWCRAAVQGGLGCRSTSDSLPPFFASHEALLLPYESALARRDDEGRWWSGSAHFLWIGERTRRLGGAHLEFMRGISNPIGVKLSSSATIDDVLSLHRVLNPENIPGKLTFIARLGRNRVAAVLPRLLEATAHARLNVAWLCDPLHGNDIRLPGGRKTRCLPDVTEELTCAIQIHARCGVPLAGIHLETTADSVDECSDLPRSTAGTFSPRHFRSACDPRLNRRQTLDLLQNACAALSRSAIS